MRRFEMGVELVLEKVVVAHPHLYEKHAPPGTTNAKYSAEFLIDGTNIPLLQKIDHAYRTVAIQAGKGDRIQFLKSPLKKGSEMNKERQAKGKDPRPELEGRYVLRASDPNYAPNVRDKRNVPIPESKAGQVVSGSTVNANVELYWSNNATNPGVYCGLRGVQLLDNVNLVEITTGAGNRDEMFKPIDDGEDSGGFGQPADSPMGFDDDIPF
jgi:hypothetical protein